MDTSLDVWAVHDHPDRLLDAGAMLCSCKTCRATLERTARERPTFVVGMKTGSDRLLVTADLLARTMQKEGGDLASLLYVEGDYVRGFYVPVSDPRLGGGSWWSLTFSEDQGAIGRKHPRCDGPRKQTKAAAKRRRDRAPKYEPVERQFVELADAVRVGRGRFKRTIASVAMWGLAHGTVVRRDVLALVLLATEGKRRWRRTDVCHEMGITILNWCSMHDVLSPDGIPETIWQWFGYLAESGELEPASDPLAELLKPLECYGGVDPLTGVRLPEDAPRPDCECYVDYRGPSFGELASGGPEVDHVE